MNILIVKTSSLGDILQTFNVAKYLKNKFENVNIDWVVEKPFLEIVSNNSNINEVIVIDSKEWRKNFLKKKNIYEFLTFKKNLKKKYYDIVFDLQGNTKSSMVTFLSNSSSKVGFSKKCVKEWPNLLFTNKKIDVDTSLNMRLQYLNLVQKYFLDENQLDFIEKKRKVLSIDKRINVMVCPGSKWENKQLSYETLSGFLHLISKNLNVYFSIIWGSPEENIVAEKLKNELSYCEVLEKQTLAHLKEKMDKMDIIISMDSAPLHLLDASKTPTFSIFGPTKAEVFKPLGSNHYFYQGSCPYEIKFEKVCPRLRSCQTGLCMKSIKHEDLYNLFISIFKKDLV